MHFLSDYASFRNVEGESLASPNSTSQIVEMASHPEEGKGAVANTRETITGSS